MTRIEVVTYDVETGCAMVDHVWRLRKHVQHSAKKLAKAMKRARRWAGKAATQDKSTTHAVLVRGV